MWDGSGAIRAAGERGSKGGGDWALGFTRILFFGVVQGVGFRPTAYRVARALGCRGYVRNNGSNVEVIIDGDADRFIDAFKKALPPLARIEKVEKDGVSASEAAKLKDDFVILQSRSGSRDSPIPPDTALCDGCLRDIFEKGNRRQGFPFTNCTDCGARFSVIRDVPYDRKNTSMDRFELCPGCRAEYEDPDNRRFHAQTISCPHDGPRYALHDGKGRPVKTVDCVAETARRLDAGKIGVIKGWGGMHIVCRIDEIARLREWYKRPSKPFAVMLRDLDTAMKWVVVDEQTKDLLTSPMRPIVLARKRERVVGPATDSNADGTDGKAMAGLAELVSPGLGNMGVYLPYSALHHLLFASMNADALAMTSANPAGEPMLLENDEAFSLGLDFYLLHDRKIINRVDDSVVIPYRGRKLFIRKSRGWVPDGIPVPYKGRILSMGAERNVTSSLSRDGKLYTTQYIGTTYRYNVYRYQEHATNYMMRLLGVPKVEEVVIDLHPQYATRRLGTDLAEKMGAKLTEAQHHWAHAASLMLDNGMGKTERCICLSIDGVGYGTDGKLWGGEVLSAGYGGFERLGTLEEFPLIGGDAAVREPARLVFCLLEQAGADWKSPMLNSEKRELFRKMVPSSPRTTSLGRVLDAVACYLGIGTERSYDGEPAMRLERYLEKGKPTFRFDVDGPQQGGPVANGGKYECAGGRPEVVRVAPLFRRLHELASGMKLVERTRADLALSFVKCIVDQMTDIAIRNVAEEGHKVIGLTGGVAYNLPINELVRKRAEAAGLGMLLHDRVPCGDGGISAGQNAIAGMRTVS